MTREQALEIARNQAQRDLSVSDSRISYVAFIPDLQDYCLCEYNLDPSQGWVFSCRMLPDEMRQPDEQITDGRIVEMARAGNMLGAIRLYRGKYQANLEDARAGVQRLLERSDE